LHSWFETAQERLLTMRISCCVLGAAAPDAKGCAYFISESRAA
jgi:hypothetical protein